MIDFLCQIEILLLEMLKLLKIPGFFNQNSSFFFKISLILGFSRLFLPKLSNPRFFQVKWQPCIYNEQIFIDKLTPPFGELIYNENFNTSFDFYRLLLYRKMSWP